MPRKRPPLLKKNSLFAFIAIFVLTLTTLASGQVFLQPAVAAPGAPGETMTVTDAAGNTFSYTIKKVMDGTGHGTNSACFITAENGYSPSDEGPDDGYVCKGDTIQWNIEWNAVIVDPSSARVNFNFNNGAPEDPLMLMLTSEPPHTNRWQYAGVTGGSDLGYVGSGTGHNAWMQFNSAGSLAGVWALSYTHTEGWATRSVGSNMLLSATAKMGAASATALADENVVVLSDTRIDSMHAPHRLDPLATTINGESYRGLDVMSSLEDSVSRQVSNRPWPNYASNKGFFPAHENLIKPLQRFTFVDAPEGTMVALPGGEIQEPLWDGPNAYIDASAGTYVKFYFPWGALPVGNYNFITRVDPLEAIRSYVGKPTFNGEMPDPGVGLSCDTTTYELRPGTLAGTRGAVNNNCAAITIQKRAPEGIFDKYDRPGANNLVLPDGTRVDKGVAANTGLDRVNSTTFTQPLFTAEHMVGPADGAQDQAFCSVWNGDEMMLRRAMPEVNKRPITEVMPGVRIYYTTQNMLPEGAPTVQAAPSCGSPSDASLWSATAPADLATVTGVMVVFPGMETLIEPTRVDLLMATEHTDNFESLLTTNVRNYAGMTSDTTVADPDWTEDFDSDYITVVKGWTQTRTGWEANSNIGIGSITYTSTIASNMYVFGLVPDDADVQQRIYLDKCMTNPQPTFNSAVSAKISGWRIVGEPDPAGGCGVGDRSYYLEIDWSEIARDDSWSLTWTAPAWSAPGDQYRMEGQWFANPGIDMLFANPLNGKNYVVVPSSVISGSKSTNDPLVEVDEPFTHTVGWFNYSDNSVGETVAIDILPWNGDGRGTSFTGDYWLESVEESFGASLGTTVIEYTNRTPSSIVNDPTDPSNQAGGATQWCTVDEFGTAGCPADVTETTALKFTIDDLGANESFFFDLNFNAEGNSEDDIYVNRLSPADAAGLELPLPAPNPVQTVVVDSSIAGTVFVDSDYSASMEDTEARLEGYELELLDADGNVVGTTTTDADGNYLFPGLKSGAYQVRLVDATPYTVITVAGTDIEEDAADGTTQVLNLGVDQDMTNVNVGLYGYSTINGTVYYDGNASTEQDATELGVEGVTLTLYNEAGEEVSTTTTNADGFYEFTELVPGVYTVEMTTPEGHTVTQVWTVTDAEGLDNTETTPIDAPVNGAVTEVDFGIFEPALISGVVYADTNGDGNQNNGETGVPGVTITLRDAETNTVVEVVETGEDGSYEFDNLPPGTYVVEMTTPDGPIVTQVWETSNPGGVPGTETTAVTEDIVAPGGSETTDVDFGLYTAVTISGTVYEDYDKDGTQDAGEPGREGWPVTLTLPDGTTLTTVTDENGDYEFIDLVPGNYTVTIQNPATGEVLTQSYQVVDPSGDTTDVTQPVTVVAADVTDVDFGIFTPLEISGYVYWDADYSTERNEGEAGISEVTITLTSPDGSAQTTTTGVDGYYEFTGLEPGTYEVTFTNPEGLIQTQMYEVTNPEGLPPAEESTSDDLTLVGENITDVNFGFNVDPSPGGSYTPPTPVFEAGL